MSYSPGKDRNMIASLRRVMFKGWFGETQPVEQFPIAVLIDNGEFLPSPNAAGTAPVPTVGVSSDNIAYIPIPTPVTCNILANANMVNTRFFIADSYYRISKIRFNYKTAGTVAGLTAQITKDTLGNGAANAASQTPGSGTVLLAAGIDLVGSTVDKTQDLALTTNLQNLYLNPGDSLSIAFTGTTTTLAGVSITVDLVNTCNVGYTQPAYQPPLQTPIFKTVPSNVTALYVALNGSLSNQVAFIANRDMTIVGAYLTYVTAFATGITIDVKKDTSTNAPAAGSSILAAPVSVTTANPGLLNMALNATANRLLMAAGDRLSISYSAGTTGAGVCLVIVFAPENDGATAGIEISLPMGGNSADKVAQYFFIANRNYEVVDASTVFPAATGTSSTMDVTIDKILNAPGAGNSVSTASFDMNATANTVQYITPAARHLRLMSTGDRLGIVTTGAALPAYTCVTVSLRARA